MEIALDLDLVDLTLRIILSAQELKTPGLDLVATVNGEIRSLGRIVRTTPALQVEEVEEETAAVEMGEEAAEETAEMVVEAIRSLEANTMTPKNPQKPTAHFGKA